MDERPVFKIKKETHPAHLNAVRVSNRAFEAITELARINATPQNEVVRQMIDFALEHMETNNSPPGEVIGDG